MRLLLSGLLLVRPLARKCLFLGSTPGRLNRTYCDNCSYRNMRVFNRWFAYPAVD